jgi:uncharacterized protein YbcV (DUF1398 family)
MSASMWNYDVSLLIKTDINLQTPKCAQIKHDTQKVSVSNSRHNKANKLKINQHHIPDLNAKIICMQIKFPSICQVFCMIRCGLAFTAGSIWQII